MTKNELEIIKVLNNKCFKCKKEINYNNDEIIIKKGLVYHKLEKE